MSQRKSKPKSKGSRGKSKKPQRVIDGRIHKTKKAPLRCSVCGRFFESLGQINEHYAAVNHPRKRKPPPRIKFSKDYSQRDVEIAEGLMDFMRNPHKIREVIREQLAKNARRRRPYE